MSTSRGSGQVWDDWMEELSSLVVGLTGMSPEDLPDRSYRLMFERGLTPAQALAECVVEWRCDGLPVP